MRRLPGPRRKPTSRWISRQVRGAGGWPGRRSVAAADAPDKPQSDSSRCGLARRCRAGGQRGPRNPGKRKRFGSLRRSGLSLTAGLTGAKARRRCAAWESRAAPSERGGEIPQVGASPREILWIRRWADCIHSEVGVRSRGRARSGSTRTSDSIAHVDGFAARHARKHSSRPLQEQAQGSTGAEKLATASPRYGLGSGEKP
jgi:hypothetical protein